MAFKQKKPIIAALVIMGVLGTLAFGFYFNKNRGGSSKTIIPQAVKKQIGSVKEKRTIKRPIPKPSLRATRKPVKKSDEKISPQPTAQPIMASFAQRSKPGKAVDYEGEMNRLNDLIRQNDKNAEAFYNRGWLYDYKGKLKVSEKDYTKAIEINKQDGDAYYNRGLIFVRMKKYKKAVKDFSEAIKLEPRDSDAYCNRGNANLQMGKRDMALKDYNAALVINPNDADLYYNRAVVYLTKGEKSKSSADLQKASKLGHKKAREYLKLPPAKPKKSETPIKTSRVVWGLNPSKVKIAGKRASGRIHGANFAVKSAKIEKGILTLRQGKHVFPDYAVMIFLFSKKGEKLEGKTYNISKNQGLGVPPIHMKWKQQGSDIPETEIFMKDYAMLLKFGKKKRNLLSGKIYLSMPDELKSFVTGTFTAKVE